MLDYVYTGWGAFWVTMFMFVPFALMAYWVIRRKSLVDTGPTRLQPGEFAPIEGVWLTFAFIFFVVANLASLKFIPWAAASGGTGGEAEVQVDFTAKSWSYDISNRQIEVGKPVRFSGRAPERVLTASFRSAGEYVAPHLSQESPYWSAAPHLGHVPLT